VISMIGRMPLLTESFFRASRPLPVAAGMGNVRR